MSVTTVLRKLGQWSVQLKPDAPPGIIAALDWLGHVAVIPGHVNPVELGDQCRALARYVGVLRVVEGGDQYTLSGSGMAYWLGDENGVGDIVESPGITISGATFANSIRALLPAGAVTEGTLTNVAGTYSGFHQWQTRRAAVDYVCDYYGGDWRVNGDATLDAGPASALFRTTPECIIARRDASGYDLAVKALPGSLESTRDVNSYSTRIVVVADGYHIGDADAATVPYRDPHGNPVVLTRIADEQDNTLAVNADVRAQLILDKYAGPRRQVRLSVDDFDVAGDIEPGDTVWVWDPDNGIYDTANEVPFRGRLLHPEAVRVLSLTWPVTDGYTVAYRDGDGNWLDLTPWVAWEDSGGGEVEIADSQSVPLTSGIGSFGTQVPGGGAGAGDASVPDVPVFGAFSSSSYQPDDGLSRASVKVTWTQPLNTDGSTIADGDHYEIRYRPTGTTDWQSLYAGWDAASATVANLPPSTGFDWQIRAVDYAAPINFGAWSATTTFSTADDTTAPATPAPATVAASLIAVQLTHTLGLASGGTYNLPLDMDHFEVHVDTSSGFTPSTATLVGKLSANAAMITGSIPAVGTFAIDTLIPAGTLAYVRVVAVDRTGNRSTASSAASATAELIDSAHITSLTASKITAGSITAAVVIGGSATFSGALSAATGTFAGSLSAATGSFSGSLSAASGTFNGSISGASGTFTGNLSGSTVTGATVVGGLIETATSGQRITMDATNGGTIWFRDSSSDFGFINGPGSGLGINSGDGGGSYRTRLYLTPGNAKLANINSSQVQVGGGVAVTPSSVTVSTTTGTAVIGSSNNNFAEFDGSTATISGGGGTSYMTITSTTVEHVSTAFKATAVYDATTGSAGNVFVNSTFQLYRSTSSRRHKVEIEPIAFDTDAFLSLQPISYYDRTQWEGHGQVGDGLRRYMGFIAEDVAEVPGVGEWLVPLDGDGLPETVEYQRIVVPLIQAVREDRARIATLEARLDALEGTA